MASERLSEVDVVVVRVRHSGYDVDSVARWVADALDDRRRDVIDQGGEVEIEMIEVGVLDHILTTEEEL